MKFAHLADCHLGSWSRKPELQELNVRAFEYAIDKCLSERVAFVLVAGDFFDISFPTNTSVLSRAFSKLRELKESNIPLYIIPGSHDFSTSGESMLKVCESAGLCVNLMSLLKMNDNEPRLDLYKDTKRNVILTGILGKRVGLEIDIIKGLNKGEIESNVQRENCLKIFLVHTAISELLPQDVNEHIESLSLRELPKGFHYYAAGHIHEPKIVHDDASKAAFAYSGCLFPNNFSELSSIKQGSFILADFDEKTNRLEIKEEKIILKEVVALEIDADDKSAKEVEEELLRKAHAADLKGKILTLKVSGTLKSGKTSEINFEHLYRLIYDKGCFSFLRNTHGLTTKESEIEVSKAGSVEDIEKEIIGKFINSIDASERKRKELLILSLLKFLDKEKAEDEVKESFSTRLLNEAVTSLSLEEKFSW